MVNSAATAAAAHAARERQRIQHTSCWSAQHAAQSGTNASMSAGGEDVIAGGEDVSKTTLQLFVPDHFQELAAFLRKAHRL